MASLRDLIFTQQHKGSQPTLSQNEGFSSPFSLRTLLSQGRGISESRGVVLPTKKVAVIQPRGSRTPWTKSLARRAKASLPVYHASPLVRIETRRSWLTATSPFAPSCTAYMYSPRPHDSSVNESSREVCRGLWNTLYFSGDFNASIRLLHALALLDSIDFDDVCKIVVTLLDCGHLQELRHLIDELTRESSPMNCHHPARRVVLLRTFCDFLALERTDLDAMARLAERSPELADVQLAGLCVKCISWGSKISSPRPGRDLSGTPARQGEKIADSVTVSDVMANISLFSHIVRSLNTYINQMDESPEELRNTGASEDDPEHKSSGAPAVGDLSKREISNLLNQLGLAFQSILQNSNSNVSVHLQALYAAYQHGLGQHGEALRRVTNFQNTNSDNPVSNQLYTQFVCTHSDLESVSLFPVISSWLLRDPLSDAAIVLFLLAVQLELSFPRLSRCWDGVSDADPDAKTVLHCLCTAAEALPDVVTFETLRRSLSAILAQSTASGRHQLDFGPVLTRNLVLSWCVWRSLACLLGPVRGGQQPSSLASSLRTERKWWSQSIFCCDRIPTNITVEESPSSRSIRFFTRKVFQSNASEPLWASVWERPPVYDNDLIGFGPLGVAETPSRVCSLRDQMYLSFAADSGRGRAALLSQFQRIGAGGADPTADAACQLIHRRGGDSVLSMARVVVDILCFQAVVSAHMTTMDPCGSPSFSGRVERLLTEVLWHEKDHCAAEGQQSPEHPLYYNICFLRAMNLSSI